MRRAVLIRDLWIMWALWLIADIAVAIYQNPAAGTVSLTQNVNLALFLFGALILSFRTNPT